MRSIALGPFSITQINELEGWRFPARGLFPTLSDDQLAQAEHDWTPRLADKATNELMLDINCWLIRTPESTILVDSGNGNSKHRPVMSAHHMFETNFLDTLRAAGAEPDDIDLVISTHLHQDHCGWDTHLAGDKWVPTFANAEHLFSRAELAHVAEYGRDQADGTLAFDFFRTYLDTIEPVLLAGLGRVVDGRHKVYDDGLNQISVEVVGGHTPGHLVVRIETAEGSAVVSGDAIHHPLQFKDLDLPQVGDVDPAHAAHVRHALAEDAAVNNSLLLTAHFPWPGRVRRLAEGTYDFDFAS